MGPRYREAEVMNHLMGKHETNGPGRNQKMDSSVSDREKIKERALKALAYYEKTKSAIRKEVRKEVARELQGFEEERNRREQVIREKMIAIDNLEEKILSLNTAIYGLESKSKLWVHECARI